jgi:CRP-like cAMP-binding protein
MPRKAPGICHTCRVRECSPLCAAADQALEAFTRLQHPYLTKQALYHEGAPALGLYVLCRGRVKLSRTDGDGREQILRLVDPGEMLGEEAVRPGSRYVGTARALEDSQAAFVGREELLGLLRSHDGVAVSLLQHLSRVLSSTQENLLRLALADARSRVAGLLLELTRRYGQPTHEGVTLRLPVRRRELAAMIGLTPETTMRLLSRFRDEGILRTDGRQVVLLRPERLETLR